VLYRSAPSLPVRYIIHACGYGSGSAQPGSSKFRSQSIRSVQLVSQAVRPVSTAEPVVVVAYSSFSVTAKRFVFALRIFNVFRCFLSAFYFRVCENVISMNFCAIESELMTAPVAQWFPFRRVAIALYGAFKWAFWSRVTSLITSSSCACLPKKKKQKPTWIQIKKLSTS